MINLENTEVVGFEAAIRGMRNPMNSWEKSDSEFKVTCNLCDNPNYDCDYCPVCDKGCDSLIGPNDLTLMKKLRNAGTDHRKYMRMITVYVDITAPLYWWKEFDTYKVGTVANSCSTMHKIHAKEFTIGDFSCEHLLYHDDIPDSEDCLVSIPTHVLYITIETLNHYRNKYIETKDKKYWWQMIQLLPTSYNQKRTVMLNYEVLANMYESRRGHKLDEWREFCKWIEEGLPYSELILGGIRYGELIIREV